MKQRSMFLSRARRGILFPVIGVLLVLTVGATFWLQKASRQRFYEAHRHTSGQVALQVAESGLNSLFATAPGGALEAGFLQSLLVDSSFSDLLGYQEKLSLEVLDEALRAANLDARCEVALRVEEVAPVQSHGSFHGILQDPREKFGVLTLDSSATFRGVTRRVRVSRSFRVLDPRIPVLSKFTLFLRSHLEGEMQSISFQRTEPGKPQNSEGRPVRPLIFFHRPLVYPTVAEGLFHDLEALFSDFAPDQAGLVFLGGDRDWNLSLVHGAGAGPFDELFHLRRAPYQTEAGLSGFERETWIWFGMYQDIFANALFRPLPDQVRELTFPDGSPVSDRTPPMHLYGDVGNVSPTVVLGNAFRSFVHLRLLDGQWYPYLEEDQFSIAEKSGFSGAWQDYQSRMARVVVEPYNRSFDFLSTNSETLSPQGEVTVRGEPSLEPPAKLDPKALTRVRPQSLEDEGFLYPKPGLGQARGIQLIRPESSSSPEAILFEGDLEQLDGAVLESLLAPRVVQKFSKEEDLWKAARKKGKLELPGFVHLDAPELQLGDLAVGQAGVLIVSGSIQIQGWIRQLVEGQPLTLVSLNGDITVATPNPVHAHLVALRGKIRFRTEQINLVGGIAADGVDWASATQGEKVKWVTYDPSLDPTDPEKSKLSLYLDPSYGVEILGH